MPIKERIIKYFDNNERNLEDEIKDLTARMVSKKTINVNPEKLENFPFLDFRGEEYRIGNIVKDFFEANDINYNEYSKQEGRPNIIGNIGKDNNCELLMPAHMDIVPAGEGWKTDPYKMVEKQEKLYGRGVLDNKGPLSSILIAGKVLKDLGIDREIEGQLSLAALSDEEANAPDGKDFGIGYLLEENLISPDWAIVPDIGENMKRIDIAEKGRSVFKVTSIGKQAHGSTPDKGINAIYKMATFINNVEKLEFDFEVHDVLEKPTLNLGEIKGGSAPNIVPGECNALIDIRSVPGMTKKSIIERLKKCYQNIDNANFKIENISYNDPHSIDPDNLVVKSIQKNTKDNLGFSPQPTGFGGGTYAKNLNMNGILAVGWGPGDDEAFHVANEYVETRQLVEFSKMICLVAIDLLN